MTLAVGGLSSLHDELIVAALRSRGVNAQALATPSAASFATGRALLARGHCNPTYLLAGALVDHALREGDAMVGYLTAGTCGPCRYATYANEFRRAFAAAGLSKVPGAVLDVSVPTPTSMLESLGVKLNASLLRALARSAIAADVVIRAGCAYRAAVAEAAEVDTHIAHWIPQLVATVARGGSIVGVLSGLGAALAALPKAPSNRVPVRTRITGQLFASLTDGDGGFGLTRWFEARGAAVEPPAIAEWLVYMLWAARSPSPYGIREDSLVHRGRRAKKLEAAVHATYARFAEAVGARPARLCSGDDLARLANPYYPSALRGGLGHTEVAELLRAQRDASAELVVSIKPFGCLPSSAISDGIARSIAATSDRVVFVSVETSGEGRELATSRLELALDRARRCR